MDSATRSTGGSFIPSSMLHNSHGGAAKSTHVGRDKIVFTEARAINKATLQKTISQIFRGIDSFSGASHGFSGSSMSVQTQFRRWLKELIDNLQTVHDSECRTNALDLIMPLSEMNRFEGDVEEDFPSSSNFPLPRKTLPFRRLPRPDDVPPELNDFDGAPYELRNACLRADIARTNDLNNILHIALQRILSGSALNLYRDTTESIKPGEYRSREGMRALFVAYSIRLSGPQERETLRKRASVFHFNQRRDPTPQFMQYQRTLVELKELGVRIDERDTVSVVVSALMGANLYDWTNQTISMRPIESWSFADLQEMCILHYHNHVKAKLNSSFEKSSSRNTNNRSRNQKLHLWPMRICVLRA